jgi:hypothetical protein
MPNLFRRKPDREKRELSARLIEVSIFGIMSVQPRVPGRNKRIIRGCSEHRCGGLDASFRRSWRLTKVVARVTLPGGAGGSRSGPDIPYA